MFRDDRLREMQKRSNRDIENFTEQSSNQGNMENGSSQTNHDVILNSYNQGVFDTVDTDAERTINYLHQYLIEKDKKIFKLEKQIKVLKEEHELKRKHRKKYKCEKCTFISYSKFRLKKHKELCTLRSSSDTEAENDTENCQQIPNKECKELKILNAAINFH